MIVCVDERARRESLQAGFYACEMIARVCATNLINIFIDPHHTHPTSLSLALGLYSVRCARFR